MAKQKQTLFFNAHLVGKFTNLYSVLVTDGKVESIVPGEGLPEEVGGGVEMVDCRQADGSCLWLSPVSLYLSEIGYNWVLMNQRV